MNLTDRLDILGQLKTYLRSDDEEWQQVKEKAFYENSWFLPQFIGQAVENIASQYLAEDVLNSAVKNYSIPETFSADAPHRQPAHVQLLRRWRTSSPRRPSPRRRRRGRHWCGGEGEEGEGLRGAQPAEDRKSVV